MNKVKMYFNLFDKKKTLIAISLLILMSTASALLTTGLSLLQGEIVNYASTNDQNFLRNAWSLWLPIVVISILFYILMKHFAMKEIFILQNRLKRRFLVM